MDSLGATRSPEYQAVIIVDYDDGRLFPLTDGCPKCLLPIANRRLLAYQLDLLSKSGALEIYIAAPKEYQTQLSQFLSEYGNSDSASVEFIWVDEMIGSADGLRAVSERIRGDFICMGSDMLSQYPFGDLAELHRSRASDVTMLLVSAPTEEAEKKGAPKKIRIDEEDQEYIGLCDDGRVVMKTPVLEIDESLKILKPLLHRCSSSLTVRNDLQDMGVYFMSKWVLTFLMANKKISSLRTELVPFLVNRQFQNEEYLYAVMPALKARTGILSAVDRWLNQTENSDNSPENSIYPQEHQELVDFLFQEISNPGVKPTMSEDKKDIQIFPKKNTNNSMNSGHSGISSGLGSGSGIKGPGSGISSGSDNSPDSTKGEGVGGDLLRCFAVVYERKGCKGAHGAQRSYRELDSLHLIQRVTTLQSYVNLNRDVPSHQHDVTTSWLPISGYHKKELSMIGDACDLGDKVTVKQCSIGKGCIIGAKSKLNNCVIMDHTVIGESCTIQNTVLSAGCIVESNCNINECYIGCGAKIVLGTKIKGESISANS